MDENPYKAPVELKSPPVAVDRRWRPITWGVIGFCVGTFFASLFVLSRDRLQCAIGGAIFGGLPTGLYFFMSVVARRRKENDRPA